MVKLIKTLKISSPNEQLFGSIASHSVLSLVLLSTLLAPSAAALAQTGPDNDNDADGVVNTIDLDDDNDGILDVNEGLVDDDGNGVPDEASADTDGDGTPDALDLDTDNDGVLDNLEARGDRAAVNALDLSPNGVIDISFEVGTNGIPTDSNGDGRPDFQDSSIQNSGDGANDTGGQTGDDSGNDGGDAGVTDGGGAGDNDGASDTDGAGADGAGDNDSAGDTGVLEDDVQDDDRPDIDGDGIANQDDLDDDNDGIPDTVEGLIDNDGDGVADDDSRDSDGDDTPDGWDLDSDNDGLLDNREGHPDFDIVISLDLVVDGAIDIGIEVGSNGLADSIETSPDSGQLIFSIQDTDADGVFDFIDLDSDNDGIPDIIEAGGVDDDGDGTIDNFFDADDKGVDDAIQASALPVFDTDGDGVADYRSTDSDRDGVPDSVEAGPMPGMPADTDGDGAADFREVDADGDMVPDNQEVGADPAAPIDSNGDGVPDFQDSAISTGAPIAEPVSDDIDNDGITNDMDLDDDNDGLLDSIEGEGDADNDTTANHRDLDSDNDGVTDLAEAAQIIEDVRALDTNNDGRLDSPVGVNGVADILESTPDSGTTTFIVADSDGDGIPDFEDLDSDNDGIYDALESGRLTTDSNGRLVAASDQNGLQADANNALLDTDGDGVVDNRDLDSDNDGLVDILEANGVDADGDGRIDQFDDLNGDGADDGLQQTAVLLIDTDADRVPDYRDLDSDQDSLSDLLETQGIAADLDNNGVLDDFVDVDRDGLDDSLAANPVRERDTDQDGMPDQVDLDSDGDGIRDLVEAGGIDIDNDGIVDVLKDSDRDAIPDSVDASITRGEDSDQDGIDDMFDVSLIGGNDADGDDIADQFDPDNDGNGFVGPAEDAGQGVAIQLPDSDNNGTPDILQSDAAAAASDVETGLDGNGFGCTLSSESKSADPMLLMLLLASFAALLCRTAKRTTLRRAKNTASLRRTGLVFATVASFALTGCSAIGLGGGEDSHKGRIYIGAGGLISEVEPDARRDATVTVVDTDSAGGSVQLGYDISNRFSLELHASDLGEATVEPAGTIGYQVGGVSALVYGLNNYDNRSRREGFSVFGRVGGGTMSNQADGVRFDRVNDFHLLGGLGLEYGFRNGLALRGELVAHDTDARFGQLGLLYRFGSATPRERSPAPRIPVPEQPEASVEVESAPTIVEPLDAGTPLDSDADGVPDSADACSASAVGVPVDNAGCALFNGVIEGVNFESGSDKLTPNAEQVLIGVAGTLSEFPDIRISIDAHTDNQGGADSNLQLSKRRAVSVARYLVEQGVSGPRLQPRAYGESQPRETNETSSGRAKNRRVEFQVVQ